LGSVLLAGCARGQLLEVAEALNARGVSHCLFVTGAMQPYGTAFLWARVGDLPCQEIWAQHRGLTAP